MDKLAADTIKKIILLKIFNSFSLRSFSYFNPAFLNFFNKNVKMP
jgi:hypothetical protein